MSTLKIGVVGYSGQRFDVNEARQLLRLAYDAVVADYPDITDVWVVSGLADLGIHSIAYREAVARGWKTKAIDCQRARKYVPFPVTELVMKEGWVNRGDETFAFLQEIDVIVRIGGGLQAQDETKIFAEGGGRTYEHHLAALSC